MAEVRSVTTSVQVRVNTGQYEGTEVFVSMTAELSEFDDPDEEFEDLSARVDRAAMLKLRALYRARNKERSAKVISRTHGVPLHGSED